MQLLSLPQEIILLIASKLEPIDFIPLLQACRTIYNILIYELCKQDVSNTGGLALSFYATWGYENRVRDMLVAGAVVDIQNPRWRDRTPLMLAISRHQTAIVKILLEYGADPNFRRDVKHGPLDIAVLNASAYCDDLCVSASTSTSMMELLLDHGADVNLGGYQDRTPLYTAIFGHEPAMVAFLLARGADVHARESKRGRTPLHIAAGERGPPEILKMILDAGADINRLDGEGETPLETAVHNGVSNSVQTLLDYGAEVRNPIPTWLTQQTAGGLHCTGADFGITEFPRPDNKAGDNEREMTVLLQ